VVLDPSALIALLAGENSAARFADAIERDPVRLLSAAGLLEAGIVIEARLGPEGGRELDLLIARADIGIEALTADQASVAREAWRRFGHGRHPAGLNFGDCFSYALARITGEPLLCAGEDFLRTDIAVVPIS
jgi:ribonuclease VapC